jgi:hypothetical protein
MTNKEIAWFAAMVDKGHAPILDQDGDLDTCAFSRDIHNGPECSVCGWNACIHCDRIDQIPVCGEVD